MDAARDQRHTRQKPGAVPAAHVAKQITELQERIKLVLRVVRRLSKCASLNGAPATGRYAFK